ncbi:MAG: YceI family protein [Deinococcales bacterium]
MKKASLICFLGLVLSLLLGAAFKAELLESSVRYTGTANGGGNPWQGVAPVDSLELSFDDGRLRQTLELKITVKADQFDGGNWLLNRNGQILVFESGKYPDIVFEATGVDLENLSDGESRAVLDGVLKLHGVEKTIEVEVGLEHQSNRLSAKGQFTILLSDYNMKRPSGFGFTIDDLIVIDFDISTELN